MTSTTELLPCPFCGGSVSICVCIGDWYNENDEIDGDSYKWTIRHSDFHSKCDLRSFDVSGRYRTLDCAEANEQKQRLIAAWNTRAAHGTLTAEQVSKAVYAHSIHADCADADWQAIADELNAALGSNTCHMSFVDEYETASGEEEYLCECSECGSQAWEPAHDLPLYCRKCGKAVKR